MAFSKHTSDPPKISAQKYSPKLTKKTGNGFKYLNENCFCFENYYTACVTRANIETKRSRDASIDDLEIDPCNSDPSLYYLRR